MAVILENLYRITVWPHALWVCTFSISTYEASSGFPWWLNGKESPNAGDLGLIPGLERSPGEGKGYPPQYSGLESSMDCIVHGVAKSQTHLSDFHFQTSSGLPQGLSGKASACSAGATGDLDLVPGSGRSLGGGHGNPLQYSSHGQRNLAGYSPQGLKESGIF